MANEYLTKSDIINWIGDWANNNPNRTDEAVEAFAKELNEQMMKLDFKVSDGRIVVDYYAEKILGKEIIEIIKPYIDEIAEESTYFVAVPRGYIKYTSKDDVSLHNFYSEGNERDTWPFIYVCINNSSLKATTYKEEYDLITQIFNSPKLRVLENKQFFMYFVSKKGFSEISQYFKNNSSITGPFDQLEDSKKYISIYSKKSTVNLSSDEYIQKRKEIDENE